MASRESYDLRLMTDEDVGLVLEWRNKAKIRAAMYTDHVISAEEHAAWWASASVHPSKRILIFAADGRPIGHVNFVQIDGNGTAYWGFYMGEDEVPLNAGIAMEFVALEYAFGELGLRKLLCEVLESNAPITRLHERFGFKREGVFERQVLKNGEYEDVISLALFAEDWAERREAMAQRVFRR